MSESPDRFDALLRHALSHPPAQEPPADFAHATAMLVADAPETASLEIWTTRVLVSLGVLGAGAYALFCVDSVARHVGHYLQRAPWPLLLTLAAAVVAIELSQLALGVRSRFVNGSSGPR